MTKETGSPHELPAGYPAPRFVKDVPPDVIGTAGKAWRFDVPAAHARMATQGYEIVSDVSVSTWLIYAPFAHPMRSFYFIGAISLAPTEGVPAAKIWLPGGTHEIMVFACAPDQELAIDDIPMLMSPGNFFGQFIEPSNEAAALRIEKAIWEICSGTLNPDSDYAYQWIERFSDSNLRRPERNENDDSKIVH
jgi:hypothetical protein